MAHDFGNMAVVATVTVQKIAGTFERIAPEVLRELLDYDPANGLFTWRVRNIRYFVETAVRSREWSCRQWNARCAGKPALTNVRSGYLRGEIFGQAYSAHECAWAIVHGYWPFEIDHINNDRSDNRLCNLREVDRAANAFNRNPALLSVAPDAARRRAKRLSRTGTNVPTTMLKIRKPA